MVLPFQLLRKTVVPLPSEVLDLGLSWPSCINEDELQVIHMKYLCCVGFLTLFFFLP
jgi:hypothetical protein